MPNIMTKRISEELKITPYHVDFVRYYGLAKSLNNTYKNQITENEIKKEFSNQKIRDKCSKLIKSQYEENPYPRWINSHFRLFPITIADFVSEPIQVSTVPQSCEVVSVYHHSQLSVRIVEYTRGYLSLSKSYVYQELRVLLFPILGRIPGTVHRHFQFPA